MLKPMFANFLMPDPPDQKVEIAELTVGPIIVVVIAFVWWFVFLRKEMDGGKKWLKWLGILPLIGMALYGLRYIGYVNNVMYMSIDGMLGTGNRVKVPHFIPTALPALGAIAMAIWGFIHSRQGYDDY